MARIITCGSQPGSSRQGRRARQPVPRTRRVEITLSGEEYAIVTDAARQAGLARAAYTATAVMAAAANGSAITGQEPLEQVLTELMRAVGLVRRISTNIGQAVAMLTATGQPAGDLPRYAAGSLRRADHIDAVADDVRKALRRDSR
jgi:hypothetical protein